MCFKNTYIRTECLKTKHNHFGFGAYFFACFFICILITGFSSQSYAFEWIDDVKTVQKQMPLKAQISDKDINNNAADDVHHSAHATDFPLLSLPSRDKISGDTNGILPFGLEFPAPVTAGSCLPLLKSIHGFPNSVASRNQRSAGEKNGLGLVLGLHFPFKPVDHVRVPSQYKARLSMWHSYEKTGSAEHTRAVLSYKDCQMKQAIGALRDFKWTR